ncbi:MAG: AMP-dependent synthetase [Phycisphaerae bacterium]
MVIDALLDAARRFPDKLAVKDTTRRLTYAQLTTFSKTMRRLVQQETGCERVGILLPASAGTLGTLLGVLWSGRTVVPLNFLLQTRELIAVVKDAGLDLVISTEYFKNLAAELPTRVLFLEQLGLKKRYLWQKLTRTPEPPPVRPEDTAALIYTSGTTALPKGVALTHQNLEANCRASIEHLRLIPDHHLLGVLPPFHVFGFTVLKFLPLYLGASVTHIPRFSPQGTYQAIVNDDISVLLAVASMYGAVARLKSLDASKFTRIHVAASGGEPLPRAVYDEFYRRTGVRIIEGYGLTETSPVVCADVPWAHRVGTVGKPISGVEVQVRGASGEVLERGQEGELCVRGHNIMKGYYQRPEDTAAVIDSQGWFKTGDLGRIDADGHISITGRAKELIIVAGENVYPREVESILEKHPAVAEAAVIGEADGSRGEVVVAYVSLREDAQISGDELRGFCRDHLAGYKVPRAVHIRSDLPKGPTGKVLKRELKAQTHVTADA